METEALGDGSTKQGPRLPVLSFEVQNERKYDEGSVQGFVTIRCSQFS